jgi:hypothetical protein
MTRSGINGRRYSSSASSASPSSIDANCSRTYALASSDAAARAERVTAA